MRHLRFAVVFGVFGLWLSSAAGAAPVSPVGLQIYVNGANAGYFDQTQIGCAPGSGENFNCSGSGQFGGSSGMNMTWNMNFDSEPVITGVTAVTNSSSSAQQFTLIFTLPTTVSPASLMGGSLQGGVTDNTGNGATITAPTGSAIYSAIIDGVLQQTLHADPFSYNEPNAFGSSSFASAAWGNTPSIPSAPGPAVSSYIRIQLDFILTGNDSASLTSNFVVVPVPEPAPATMMLLGLGVLALRRRSAR